MRSSASNSFLTSCYLGHHSMIFFYGGGGGAFRDDGITAALVTSQPYIALNIV